MDLDVTWENRNGGLIIGTVILLLFLTLFFTCKRKRALISICTFIIAVSFLIPGFVMNMTSLQYAAFVVASGFVIQVFVMVLHNNDEELDKIWVPLRSDLKVAIVQK